MSHVYFIGCLHLGHENMARFRGFQDSYYHDEKLIHNYNSIVAKRDLVYILGDITMETPEHYYQLDRLNGRKKVVLGNHDRGKDVPELLNYVETVSGAEDYKGFMLTHIPIHPNEISFWRGNIHAHIHHNDLHDVYVPERYGGPKEVPYSTVDKYFHVDAHRLDFRPVSIDQILNK